MAPGTGVAGVGANEVSFRLLSEPENGDGIGGIAGTAT